MQRAYRVPHPMSSSRLLATERGRQRVSCVAQIVEPEALRQSGLGTHSGQRPDRCDLLLAGPGLGVPAILGRSRIGFGNFMAETWRAVRSRLGPAATAAA